MKIGFIGCGNMGGALAKAVSKAVGAENVYVYDIDIEKAKFFAEENDVIFADLEYIALNCDYIFLGVKPQMLRSLMEELVPVIAGRTVDYTIVSMAAGVAVKDIGDMLGTDEFIPIIRIMPNMPVAVGSGMILYTGNKTAMDYKAKGFCEIMQYAGVLDKVDENKIDAASAVSGCGPAFAFMFCEALADGAVACGLSREKALLYAAQTLAGSAKQLLESGEHPGKLKDAVCSPAGSTIEGVNALENGGFRASVMDAVRSSYERTVELGK